MKYGLTLETRAFSQLKFRHIFNLEDVAIEEPVVRQIIDQCHLQKYLEAVGQGVDYTHCADFLCTFNMNRGTITV